MPNVAEYAFIICPYFLRFTEDRRSVVCEGLVPGAVAENRFPNKRDMKDWVLGVCETHGYEKHCLLAQTNGRKYEAG